MFYIFFNVSLKEWSISITKKKQNPNTNGARNNIVKKTKQDRKLFRDK